MNHIKHILLFNLLSLLCAVSYAQNLKFDFQSGVGTYDMSDLKDFNNSVFKSLPFQAKVISDYPAFIYYKPSVLFSFNKFEIGLQGTFLSTGSRISSKDYSGQYLFDTKIHSWVPGLVTDISLIKLNSKSKIWLTAEGGVTNSSIEMKENFTFKDETINDSSRSFNSTDYYALPGLKFEYKLYPSLGLEFNSGYFFHIANAHFESDTGELLTFGPDWSGIRIGLSIFWTTPFKKPELAGSEIN